jgi:hypothetical protein
MRHRPRSRRFPTLSLWAALFLVTTTAWAAIPCDVIKYGPGALAPALWVSCAQLGLQNTDDVDGLDLGAGADGAPIEFVPYPKPPYWPPSYPPDPYPSSPPPPPPPPVVTPTPTTTVVPSP